MKRSVLQFVIAAIASTAIFPSAATTVSSSTSGPTGTPVETTTCKVCDKSAGETSGSISFDIDVEQSGTYILKLWQCPAMLPSGNLQSYTIFVNGEILQSDLTPQTEGWSYLSTSKPVRLTTGSARITVNSSLPAIPNVEFVEIKTPESILRTRNAAPTKYDNYIAEILRDTPKKASIISPIDPSQPKDTIALGSGIGNPLTPTPPHDYLHCNISWFGYTFYTTAYFKAGQNITCSSTAVGGVSHFLELFSASSPVDYSYSKLSDSSGKASISISIPASGIYYIKVRTFKNGSRGLCNVNINNTMSYNNVPMCTMGLKANYKISSDSYSTFTTNSQSDPFMWVYYGGTEDCKMYMFNNDYEPSGNFDWGKNARISKLSSPVIERVLISSAGSYDPIGKCELYIGCKEFRENNSTNPIFNISSFPNMKTDDTMVSAPADSTYNCFAWAGGVHSEVFWPTYKSSPYYSDQIVVNRTPLDALDQYYASERYPGCTRYVRTSSTTENVTGGIDVWATTSGTITHASINQNSDANYHGYAWESKLGTKERIFHVRDALISSTYGKIAYHYEPVNDGTTTVSLEEAIANETAVMDNPILTDVQEYFISSGIASMATADKVKFNTLYNKWQQVWNHSVTGNPEIIKEESTYAALLESCRTNPEYMLFIYDKINRGVASVIPLFEDLVFTDNQGNMARIKDIRDAREQPEYDAFGRKIIRTAASNLKRLLKQILPDTGSAENENITVNRESQFDLSLTGNRISATIALARPTDVSIDILDLECRPVCVIKEGGAIDSGNYRFSSHPMEPGIYLVRCMLNGWLNVKKIIIK